MDEPNEQRDRSYAGCQHVSSGSLTPMDWRWSLDDLCSCCGRGTVARHAEADQPLCEDCGGIVGAPARPGRERWVVEIDLAVPIEAQHEEEATRLGEALLDRLNDLINSDPTWVGGMIVRPWRELDELE